MVDTYTGNTGQILQVSASNRGIWGVKTNTNWLINSLLSGGNSSKVFTNVDITVVNADGVADDGKNSIFTCSGTLSGDVNLILPTVGRHFLIVNNCTGAYTLTVKTVSGTGVIIPQTAIMPVYCDGVNILAGINYLGSGLGTMSIQDANSVTITGGSVTGITDLAVADGGTGASTTAGARTNLGLLSMATQAASSVAITGGSITGMSLPMNPSDVATKAYADSAGGGTATITACNVATTAALTAIYNNGTAGVGATLTNSGTQAALVIDTVTLAAGNRVVVKNQATTAQNGIYSVTDTGSVSTNWILTRTTDYDQNTEILNGSNTVILQGASYPAGNLGTQWFMSSPTPTTIGTDPITFGIKSANFLIASSNLADVSNPATARTNLGLGTIATQAASSVSITGGAADGITIGGTTPCQAQVHRPTVSISGTTRTLALTDADSFQLCNNASTQTITIPPHSGVAFVNNTEIDFFQQGAGQVVFVAGAGVTILSKSSNLKLAGQGSGGTIKQVATNTWSLVGDLTA